MAVAQGRSREGWGPERRRTRAAPVQPRRSERLLLLPAALLGALAGGGQVQCRALVQQRRHQAGGRPLGQPGRGSRRRGDDQRRCVSITRYADVGDGSVSVDVEKAAAVMRINF